MNKLIVKDQFIDMNENDLIELFDWKGGAGAGKDPLPAAAVSDGYERADAGAEPHGEPQPATEQRRTDADV